jgi:hypothetical protein
MDLLNSLMGWAILHLTILLLTLLGMYLVDKINKRRIERALDKLIDEE